MHHPDYAHARPKALRVDVQATVAMTLQVLMVAEKPSIAGSIADVLGGRNITTRRKRVPVHEFSGTFEGRGCDFRVRYTI